MNDSRSIAAGTAAGLAAGALWGLVFVLPRIVDAYSGMEVTLGRYAAYAVVAVAALAWSWRSARSHLSPRVIAASIGLGWLGNSIYYLLLVFAVRWAGTALTGLIIGTIPLWLLLLGRPKGLGLARIAPAGACTAAGLALMHWSVSRQGSSPELPAGLACAVAALLCWTGYAVLNARWLQARPGLPNAVWTSLLGVSTLVGMLPMLIVMEPGAADRAARAAQAPWFVLVSLVMGLGASWLATWLWNVASQRLPTSLAGQLIVSETLFALAYGFVYDGRWPAGTEWLAALLFSIGILWAIRTHRH